MCSLRFHSFIHSFRSLSYDRSIASSKASSGASSFNFQYPLLSLKSSTSYLCLLPCLPVTFVPPTIVSSIAFLRRQLFRKMSPILPAFLLFIACRTFPFIFSLCSNSLFLTRSSLQMKVAFMNKLRANRSRKIFAILRCRMFCFPLYYPKV